jgi:catechol 2,3-dioxygenase-like lactoylglutathione lyase family enzyme
MINHISLSVKNFDQRKKFYEDTLKCLGIQKIAQYDLEDNQKVADFANKEDMSVLSISNMGLSTEQIGNFKGFHIAFNAHNRNEVNAWYEKCMELGGICNGPPNLRPEYTPDYYAAFVIDPNGYRIESCYIPN